jgi:hypothetical protein
LQTRSGWWRQRRSLQPPPRRRCQGRRREALWCEWPAVRCSLRPRPCATLAAWQRLRSCSCGEPGRRNPRTSSSCACAPPAPLLPCQAPRLCSSRYAPAWPSSSSPALPSVDTATLVCPASDLLSGWSRLGTSSTPAHAARMWCVEEMQRAQGHGRMHVAWSHARGMVALSQRSALPSWDGPLRSPLLALSLPMNGGRTATTLRPAATWHASSVKRRTGNPARMQSYAEPGWRGRECRG